MLYKRRQLGPALEGFRPQGALQAWPPCPCRRLREGDCRDSGPGSLRLLPRQRKDGENSSPRGRGRSGGRREFRRIRSLKSISLRLPLNSCGTYNFSPLECRYGIHSQSGLPSALTRSQSGFFFFFLGGVRAEKRGKEKKRHCFFQLRRDKWSNNNIMVTMTIVH